MSRRRTRQREKRKKRQSEETPQATDRVSLVLTLVVVSVFAIFGGYLVGQYAVRWVAAPLMEGPQLASEGVRFSESAADDPLPTVPTQSRSSADPSSVGSSETSAAPSASQPQVAMPSQSQAAAPAAPSTFRVHVGRFRQRADADSVADRLRAGLAPDAWITYDQSSGEYRVQVGAFSNLDRANEFVSQLSAAGYDAFIAR